MQNLNLLSGQGQGQDQRPFQSSCSPVDCCCVAPCLGFILCNACRQYQYQTIQPSFTNLLFSNPTQQFSPPASRPAPLQSFVSSTQTQDQSDSRSCDTIGGLGLIVAICTVLFYGSEGYASMWTSSDSSANTIFPLWFCKSLLGLSSTSLSVVCVINFLWFAFVLFLSCFSSSLVFRGLIWCSGLRYLKLLTQHWYTHS